MAATETAKNTLNNALEVILKICDLEFNKLYTLFSTSQPPNENEIA